MEITQDNFEQTLPLVRDSIDQADFISLDLEFSGYTSSLQDRENEYDTVEERYQKVRSAVNQFVCFQVGICCWRWDDVAKKYKYRPFSFYVWPKSKILDRSMMFQSSAVSFLIQNNFDFNKLFDKGINYGRYSEQDYLKNLCRQKVTKNFESVRSFSILSKTHQQDLQSMLAQIKEFVYDPTTSEKLTFQIDSYALKKALSRKVTETYMNTGIFTEFTRQSAETVIKKSKTFRQVNFLGGKTSIGGSINQQSSEQASSHGGFSFTAFEGGNKLSGKQTAVTNTVEPQFGFCEEDQVESEAGVDTSKISDQDTTQKEGGSSVTENAEKKAWAEYEQENSIERLLEFEVGFSRVMQQIASTKKPVIGHNMKFDLAFIYHQFYKKMPDTYVEFAESMCSDFFPSCYDTKVLCLNAGKIGKSDLQHLYAKCTQDKKYNNNLCFEADCKKQYTAFSIYEQNGGQGHDAGFDAFMTGLVFATLSKFIEIGNIVNKGPKIEQMTRAQKREELEKQGLANNKRNRKALDKEIPVAENPRNIKHFSAVQNKEIYYADIKELENKVMMQIDVPAYWHLKTKSTLSVPEIDHQNRLHDNVVYLKLNQMQSTQSSIAQKQESASVFDIGELFSRFGDINVVRSRDHACYVDFQDFDREAMNVAKGKNFRASQEILKLIKKELGKKNPNTFKDFISEAVEYKESEKFKYDNHQCYEGGF